MRYEEDKKIQICILSADRSDLERGFLRQKIIQFYLSLGAS